ncbi:MAG: hydroxyacid dehydrogenase [Melioribacteraceae bacterium]
MKKILIAEKVHKNILNLFGSNDILVDYLPDIKRNELLNVISNYNVLIVRSAVKADSELINLGSNLELIGRAGTGVDNVDVDAATRKGIIVMNTPGGNTISAAEHTISLLLSMCRQIPQANYSLRSGKWDRKSYSGTEIFGKTFGIIGLGKIGREVAIRLKSFGMKLVGFDPFISEELTSTIEIKFLTLEELYKESDFISLHVPLTEGTKNLLSSDTLYKCKKGVRIINCARGGLINEVDLLNALNDGHVAGAAIDVFENEPLTDFSLINHPNVVATPHLGASTDGAQEKVAVQLGTQILNWINGQGLFGSVNAHLLNSYL